MKKNLWSLPVSAVVGLFLLSASCQNQSEADEKARLISALNDSIKHYKKKNYDLTNQISAFETQKAETFLHLQNKDEKITALHNLIKKAKAKEAALTATNTRLSGYSNYKPVETDSIINSTVTMEAEDYSPYHSITDSINSTVTMEAEDYSPYHSIKVRIDSYLNDKVCFNFNTHRGKIIRHCTYGGERGVWEYSIEIKDSLVIQHKRDSLGRMYVEVENMNPYSVSPAVRSYYKTQPD